MSETGVFVKFVSPESAKGFKTVMVPNCEESEEKFNKAKRDWGYRAWFKHEQHRKFRGLVFAALGDLFENQEEIESRDVHRAKVYMEIGWVYDNPIVDENGTHWVVRSLSFAQSNQAELERFWELLQPFIAQELGEEWLQQYVRL